MVQAFTDMPNLERLGPVPRAVMTNGTQVVGATAASGTTAGTPQKAPIIVMRPGGFSRDRDADVNAMMNPKFTGTAAAQVTPLPEFRQIAQDGVQFDLHKDNHQQPLTSPNPDTKNGTKFALAPGGRADLLVQAPQLSAGTTTASYEFSGVVNVTVCGDPVSGQNFPTDANYPKFPRLNNIRGCRFRELTFGWEPFRIRNGPANNGANPNVAKTLPFEAQINPTPKSPWLRIAGPTGRSTTNSSARQSTTRR